ncbi:TetR/AcrR family transcriptional regulator [Brucella intermedia]|uniref:acrylate utilization transcriptional regulator AcuR n=1 Tax=Brucella intermedia TaxID=94625 RepID=UPI003AB8A810
MDTLQPTRRRGRPPKADAGFSKTRESLVRAGVIALTEKGFSATGLDEILKTVAVPKGSFYHYFDSKEAFGAELIDSYGRYFDHKLDQFFGDHALSPLNRLRAFIRDAEDGMERYRYSRGCLVGNLGQEMGALPESFRGKLSTIFIGWQRRTAECLRSGQVCGEIAAHHDVDNLSAFFWIGWEGAVLRAKLERSVEPLRIFSDGFLTFVEN